MKVALVTGADGLIGSEAPAFFSDKFDLVVGKTITGNKRQYTYSDQNRVGDHMWYVSDVGHFQRHYPGWLPEYGLVSTLTKIFNELRLRQSV